MDKSQLNQLTNEEVIELYKLVQEHLQFLKSSILVVEEDGDENE